MIASFLFPMYMLRAFKGHTMEIFKNFVVVDHMQRHVFRSEYLAIIITMLYVLYIVDLDNCIAGTITTCG